jgi:hypothetical protein
LPGKHAKPGRHRRPSALSRARGSVAGGVRTRLAVHRPGLAAAAVGAVTATVVLGAISTTSAGRVVRSPTSQEQSHSFSADSEYTIERSGHVDGLSRAAVRAPLPTKSVAIEPADVSGGTTRSVAPPTDPQDIAMLMLAEYGWDDSEFPCLDALWTRESNWSPFAQNTYSGAYGIPQALPGSKMASVGSDWATNPATQIEWGLDYIQDRYGSPCSADSFQASNGWY